MQQPINTILHSLIPAEHRWKIELFKHWNDIIGNMGDKVIIQEIKDSVLILSVSHPTWAHELFLLIPLLKQKINSYLANDPIKSIRLRVKTIQSRPSWRRNISKPLEPLPTPACPSVQEEALLNTIQNRELREALNHFLVRCKHRNGGKQ